MLVCLVTVEIVLITIHVGRDSMAILVTVLYTWERLDAPSTITKDTKLTVIDIVVIL